MPRRGVASVDRYEPERHRESVLEPFDLGGRSFDSVGMNYLLHCLPGDIRSKAVVFEHVKAVTESGSVVFGATLVHDGVDRNWMARTVMKRNNRHGIFSNADDDIEGLDWALSQHLTESTIEIVGCVALFAGRT